MTIKIGRKLLLYLHAYNSSSISTVTLSRVTIQRTITTIKPNKAVEHELANVLFSVLLFADEYDIDLSQALQDKIEHNAKKHMIEKRKGMNKKYDEY